MTNLLKLKDKISNNVKLIATTHPSWIKI